MGKVLIIRGGALGDFLLTVPAIVALKSQLPSARIDVLGYPGIASISKAAGLVENVRSIEYAAMAKFFVPGGELDQGLSDYFASFDVVISYLFDLDGFFEANLKRAGVETLLIGPGKIDPSGEHAAHQLAAPLEQLALFLEDACPVLTVEDHQSRLASSDHIAIHPGSGGVMKNWPVHHWIQLGRKLMDRFAEKRILLVVGEAEKERGVDEEIRQSWQREKVPFDLADSLTIPELAAELAACRLFLGHDTGVSHLAAAMGIDSVLLFGPTDPAVWAPQSGRVRVIQSEAGELNRLPVDEVLARVCEVFEGGGEGRDLTPGNN